MAQHLADGLSATEAHAKAGYSKSRANASRLQQDDSIKQRVIELLSEREHITAQATAQAIEKTALTKEWVIERLIENVNRSMTAEAVMREGLPTGGYVYQGSVANKSLELLGKELGMFIDRAEIKTSDISNEPEPTPDEWANKHSGH